MLVVAPEAAHAYTPDDTLAAIDDVSARLGVSHARLSSMVSCETGGTFEPSIVGDHGTSFGPVQLHKGGLLEHFHAQGYIDPFDPWEAVEYLGRVLAGEWPGISGRAWTCR
jgi:hypothetical protein